MLATVVACAALSIRWIRRHPLYRAWRAGWNRYNKMTPEEREREIAELRAGKGGPDWTPHAARQARNAPAAAAQIRRFALDEVERIDDTIGRGATCTVQLARLRAHAPTAASAAANDNSHVAAGESSVAAESSSSSSSPRAEYVALKIVATDSSAAKLDALLSNSACSPLQRLEHEQLVLSSLSHPGVMRLLGEMRWERERISVLQLCPRGSLATHLQHHRRRLLPLATVRAWLAELLVALQYVHSQGWAHGDLSAKNCMLDASGHIVLVDFGMSRSLSSAQQAAESGATLPYLSPEKLTPHAFRGAPVDEAASDFWAAGVLFHEMLLGRLPFESSDEVQLLESMMAAFDEQGNLHLRAPPDVPPPSTARLSHDAADLLARLMCLNPMQRGVDCAAILLKHPFFASAPLPNDPRDLWLRPAPAEFLRHLGAIDDDEPAA